MNTSAVRSAVARRDVDEHEQMSSAQTSARGASRTLR